MYLGHATVSYHTVNIVVTFYFIEFVLNKFPSTAKTDLKDAVNDCCCNARRKIKRQ